MGYESTIYVGYVDTIGKRHILFDRARFDLGKTGGMPDCFHEKFNGGVLSIDFNLTIDAYGDPLYICTSEELCTWLKQQNVSSSIWNATARAIKAYTQGNPNLVCVHVGY